MGTKLTLAALALMLAPGWALAMGGGCSYGAVHDTTASSCVDGAVWDETTGACVPATTS
jgi:hypothetical protein